MRATWIAVLITGLALIGCGGPSESEPQQVPVANEEDAYQTAVYAQQRAEWEERAEQGDPRAQRQLGIMYYLGQGIEKDFNVAHEWLSKAASQGDDVAQLTLGVMSKEGQGVPANPVDAYKWLSLAAEQGNASAKIRLKELEPTLSEDELAQARKLAEEWEPAF